MEKLNDSEIRKIWDVIETNYNKYLKCKGVVLPKLQDLNGRYTKNALALVCLAYGYPNTKVVSKEELTSFIKLYYPQVTDVQQGRHLGMQGGWNIISGQRGDFYGADKRIPAGTYKLVDLKNSHPAFLKSRREGFKGNFEKLKSMYDYRCACCGAKEGEKHWLRKGVIVQLQKGHMNPNLPLTDGNIIPQCQICNRADRDRWIYDKTGRVIGVADSEDGFRIVGDFIKRVEKKYTREELVKKIFN